MLRKSRIRGVIFDLDNTLVESEIDYDRMKRDVLEELRRAGVDPTVLDEGRTVVDNLRAGKEDLATRDPGLDPMEIDRRINALLTAREMERIGSVRLLKGVMDTLRRIEGRGMRTAVLTRGSRCYALKVLELTGLDGRVGPCVCRDDHPLEEAKPSSKAMERAAALLGMRPEDCIYIGDHPMDLDCARTSGASFVGVLTGSTDQDRWRRCGCELVVASVADLPDLLERLPAQDSDS